MFGDSHLELTEAHAYVTDAGYKVLAGSIPETIAYRRASNEGRALTDTRFPSLNDRADKLAQIIIELVAKIAEGEGRVIVKVRPPRRKGDLGPHGH